MNCAVFSAGVCICADRLYVIRYGVEYLDRGATSWTVVTAPLPYEIGIHSCVSIGSSIYIAGTYIRDVVKLDVETRAIEKLASFETASGPLEVIGRCVYNISGPESDWIECFNVDTLELSRVAKLKGATTNHSVVRVVDYPDFRRIT